MAGQPDAQLSMSLARMAEQDLGELKAQGLASTAWALAVAKAGRLDAQLFTTLARVAERRVGDFNEQNLSNIA